MGTINTGFDLNVLYTSSFVRNGRLKPVYDALEDVFRWCLVPQSSAKASVDSLAKQLVNDELNQVANAYNKILDMAMDILRKQTPLWSHNMFDFSLSTQIGANYISNNKFVGKARVGIDSEEIGNTAHWTAYRTRTGNIGYFYKSKKFRMKPNFDYSGLVERGAGHTKHKGFMQTTEQLIDKIVI